MGCLMRFNCFLVVFLRCFLCFCSGCLSCSYDVLMVFDGLGTFPGRFSGRFLAFVDGF